MNNNKILVSVVVPVYNTEDFLSECVDSILAQTHRYIEVILVDDGSTDTSGMLCDEYVKADARIRVLHQKNGGVSSARNTGIWHATGEFITFIDADDAIHCEYVRHLCEDMVKYGADTTTTAAKDVASRNIEIISEPVKDAEVTVLSSDETIKELYRGSLEGTRNGVQMFSLKMLKDNSIRYDEKMAVGEDFDFFARAILASNKVVVDKRRMYFYRTNPSSVMLQSFNRKHFEAIKNIESIGRSVEGRIEGLQKLIDTMVFSDAIFYGSKMITQRNSWSEEYAEIAQIIKKNRYMVLTDKHAKKNMRIKALIVAVLGVHFGLLATRSLIRW
jgi:glycosyltransferase involved in cell wall biosynthesis